MTRKRTRPESDDSDQGPASSGRLDDELTTLALMLESIRNPADAAAGDEDDESENARTDAEANGNAKDQ